MVVKRVILPEGVPQVCHELGGACSSQRHNGFILAVLDWRSSSRSARSAGCLATELGTCCYRPRVKRVFVQRSDVSEGCRGENAPRSGSG